MDANFDPLHVRLFKCELLAIGPEWNARDVRSAFWRCYVNDRDGAALDLKDGLYPLEGVRLYFVPAGVHFSCLNTQQIRHFYAHFDIIGLSSLSLSELFGHPLCPPCRPDLGETLNSLKTDLDSGRGDDLLFQCRVKSLIYDGLVRHLDTVPPDRLDAYGQKRRAQEPVRPALRHIEEHLAERLTVRDLARLCHLSEDYFIRRFGECVGTSPLKYLMERRVTVAAQRLIFTDDSIERVAQETGFGSRFYFSRVFTRAHGVSPAAYRKGKRV